MAIKPFKINIPEEEVERLRRKIEDTRIPKDEIVPDAGEDYGPSMKWIHRLYNRWLNEFDWYKIQDRLNRHNHHIATMTDDDRKTTIDIHFTHTRSKRSDAIPIILIHGWPGSFYEFDRVVDKLACPSDDTDPAFNVIAVNLPGFMWSSPPPRRGWTMQDSARICDKLMQELGYHSYVAQAGDWGMFVARELGAKYDGCKGVHLNFCPTPLPEHLTAQDLTEREKKIEVRCQQWLDDHLGYAVCMRTRPQAIGVALIDNPVGLLMWVGEKYNELAHPANQDSAWEEALLTQVSLYYFSGCIMSSTLPYYENVKHAGFGKFVLAPENHIKCPFGFTSYMYDSRPGTKRGVERSGNLVYYNEYDDGGHFAALECPDIFVKDCRELFGKHFKP